MNKQKVIAAIYAVYNKKKWFDMENGEVFMDELVALMEKIEGMGDEN